MELHITSRLNRADDAALQACSSYLYRLPLSATRRRDLLARMAQYRNADPEDALYELHRMLGETANAPHPALASVAARLKLAQNLPPEPAERATRAGTNRVLLTMPPLARSSMAPRQWVRRSQGNAHPADSPQDPRGHWHRIAAWRRFVLVGLIITQTWIATDFMGSVLPYQGRQPLEIPILILFAILFGWISAGFWTAMAGLLLLRFRSDGYAISATARKDAPIDAGARTAIIMPIYNESVARVFAGLRATYESVAKTGLADRFDFFILSDSNDPELRVAELQAWLDMCHAVNGFGRIFYRWRTHRIKRKSGNIADFCRRWGRLYRYMVVLDADSIMSGECLTTLVRLMEANPNAGIIQTAPRAAGRETLYARVQQFATRLYGPLYTAGLHFWQLGESHYWGHNAIIRVAPFMRHCALRRLPGKGALSGEILSHDFVEAALMRRAGWAVWIAYDVVGSYEEMPPNLVDELQRDRRWCQGNLMNFRLFLMKGLHPAHRAVFMTGVMAYLSAPLWFAQLILATALLAVHTLGVPQYFVHPYQLFPLWPEWRPERAITLFSTTAVLLFLPKILCMLSTGKHSAQGFGGRMRLASSMFAELLVSALLAPIRMLFHTQFVLSALSGWGIQWKSPPREDAETGWREALRRHGVHTLLGIGWAGGVYWLNPSYLWWLLPVVGALMLSIPLSVYTSRVSLGRKLKQAGYLVIPEESHPPREIRGTAALATQAAPYGSFVAAVTDPLTNALVCAAHSNPSRQGPVTRAERAHLLRKARTGGPAALTAREKNTLLGDPLALATLHVHVWAPDALSAWHRYEPASTSPLTLIPSRVPVLSHHPA
jgi:membrane glycosyltransferase